MITVKRFQDSQAHQNAYLIREQDKVLVVDPGFNGKEIVAYLQEKNLRLMGVLLTHAHFDHVKDLPMLAYQGPIDVFVHELEVPTLYDEERNYSRHFNTTFKVIDTLKIRPFSADGLLPIDAFSVMTTHSPGHTKGSCLYKIDNHLFTGDTLFLDSVGRTDLVGGDLNKLRHSLKTIKDRYSKQSIVHPGHNEEGVLKDILLNNPFMKNL